MAGATVNFMTGKAPDLSCEKEQWEASLVSGYKIDRMMVLFVVVTVVTEGRWVGALREKRAALLRIVR